MLNHQLTLSAAPLPFPQLPRSIRFPWEVDSHYWLQDQESLEGRGGKWEVFNFNWVRFFCGIVESGQMQDDWERDSLTELVLFVHFFQFYRDCSLERLILLFDVLSVSVQNGPLWLSHSSAALLSSPAALLSSPAKCLPCGECGCVLLGCDRGRTCLICPWKSPSSCMGDQRSLILVQLAVLVADHSAGRKPVGRWVRWLTDVGRWVRWPTDHMICDLISSSIWTFCCGRRSPPPPPDSALAEAAQGEGSCLVFELGEEIALACVALPAAAASAFSFLCAVGR